MKLFESKCHLGVPKQTLPYLKYQITKELILQSHALLCKNPIEGYKKATNLPQEIIEMILIDYVGLIYINKYQSTSSSFSSSGQSNGITSYKYREMNMNTMRKLIEKNKINENNKLNIMTVTIQRFLKFFSGSENMKNYMIIFLFFGIILSQYLLFFSFKKEEVINEEN